MQRNSLFKSGAQYPIVAVATAVVLALVTMVLIQVPKDGVVLSLSEALRLIDMRVAAGISVASLVFAGLWKVDPATPLGQWAMRGAIAMLVIVNWAAWSLALWLH